MKLSLIDLHCDTASELYHQRKSLLSNDLHVSLDKTAEFGQYTQVFAIYTDAALSDEEGYDAFFKIKRGFDEELLKYSSRIASVLTADDLGARYTEGRSAAILAVEDARLLSGDLSRLNVLYENGVRFLTLTWSGDTCIGGSWNTKNGLSPFGADTVKACFRLGIVPDVSHASPETVDDVIPIAIEFGKPIVATHSNAFSVYPHGRNLRDEHFQAIRDLGGLVGINLYKDHLTDTRIAPATVDTVLSHIEHFLSLGGENTVALGADYDGAELPSDIPSIASVTALAERLLQCNYSEELVRKIFYRNAEAFLFSALPH